MHPLDGVCVGALKRETVRLPQHNDIHARERSPRRTVELWKVRKSQIAGEFRGWKFRVVAYAFVVVQEFAAAVHDQLVLLQLAPSRVMR